MTVETDLTSPLVIGFGVVGRAVGRALLARGHTPVIVEDRPSDEGRHAARDLGVELIEAPSRDELSELVRGASVLLPSPGVPDHHPCFTLAAEAGVVVRSEFDLARMWDDRPLVAITGTNGKTTVTMIVTDALERSGRKAEAVGNTEVPLVSAIDDEQTEIFVVEASSFRLGHSGSFRPDVATWLNFAPDHLDAHASLESYEQAKAAVWADLADEGVAIANGDDPVVVRHLPAGRHCLTFSVSDRAADWHLEDGSIVGPDGPLMGVGELARSQPHDIENALAVAATAGAAGASSDALIQALASYRGLPHRLELVGEWDQVSWYNDSKATVPQATEAAVGGFASVVLIAGGRNKGLSLEGLGRLAPPVHHVIAIGDAADEVCAVFNGVAPTTRAGSMGEAIAAAHSVAEPGDAVLLSPGCTSFDWYGSYVERGLDFMRLVRREVGHP
jgi:UDP-N-acetylmuramoylalanine--D-glutamate ligase